MNITELAEKAECQGIAGKLFGHKFEANYNKRAPVPGKTGPLVFADDLVKILHASTSWDYVNSVCTRCGAMKAKP